MSWSASVTPLNPAFRTIDGWNKSKEAGFKAGFKKHALSRVATPLAVAALGSVSFVYNAGSFVLKSPICLAKYTILLVVPVKVNGKWCSVGSCVPKEFGAKEMCKHGLKAVAFLVEVVVCPALGVASPSFVVWLNVKCHLVDLRQPQHAEVSLKKDETPGQTEEAVPVPSAPPAPPTPPAPPAPPPRPRPPVLSPADLRRSLLDELRAAKPSDLKNAGDRVLAPKPPSIEGPRQNLLDEIRRVAQAPEEGSDRIVPYADGDELPAPAAVRPPLLRTRELSDEDIDAKFKRYWERFMCDKATAVWSSRSAVSHRQHLEEEFLGINDSLNCREIVLSDEEIARMNERKAEITAELASMQNALAYIHQADGAQQFVDAHRDEIEEQVWTAMEGERIPTIRLTQFRARHPHGMTT